MAGTYLLEMQLMDGSTFATSQLPCPHPRALALLEPKQSHSLRIDDTAETSDKKYQKEKNTLVADLESEVNAMTLAYAAKLGSVSQNTNVGTQKVDGSECLSSPFPIRTYGL